MTDKELLEKAAKAAGIEIHFDEDGDCYRIKASGNRNYWNPLSFDGDALRLAVKLGFTVRIDKRAGFSWVKGFEGSSLHYDDPYAATRRAIVRAAAEIGKAGA